MPSANKTPNYNLNQWQGNEYPKRQDFADDNLAIDGALTPTADLSKIPVSNGPHKLVDWVSFIANRIKTITGKANWWDAPSKTLEDVNTHLSDYVRQSGYAVATGSANAYAITLNPAPTAYVNGMCIAVNINVTNTGASTINVNGLGSKNIIDSKGAAMTAGKLKAASIYTMRLNGTNFILQGEGGSGNATASDLLSGKTASTDAGDITGTIPIEINGSRPVSTDFGYGGSTSAGDFYVKVPPYKYYEDNVFLKGNDPDLIASNIRSGVNILGVNGSVVPLTTEKKTATGTTTTNSVNGNLVVTGLGFTPSLVIVNWVQSNTYSQRTYVTGWAYSESHFNTMQLIYNGNNFSVVGAGGQTVITPTAGGFSLLGVIAANIAVQWKAYE